MALAVSACAAMLAACGRTSASAPAAPTPPARSDAPATASVELTAQQLDSIRVGTVEPHAFAVDVHAFGSVAFDEDSGVVQAESALVAAAAAAQAARKTLARVQGLGEANGIATKDIEQALAARRSADAALDAAREAVRALGVDGAEIRRLEAGGKSALSGKPANHAWVVADVAESDSPQMRIGQSVEVEVAALPGQRFAGRIERLYGIVDASTHRLAARCLVDDADGVLRPGMLADVSIRVAAGEASSSLPENGVVREGDGSMTAWVAQDGRRFAQRAIKTGLRGDGRVQVLSGLAPGERVVVDGAVFLSGMLQGASDD